MGQELWLQERQLSQLHQLDAQFVARSGMEQAVSTGLLRGRPFGGVSIAWSGDLDHVISPIPNYRHKRVAAAELNTSDGKILLLSIYMPFYNAGKREQCLDETINALSMIELLIHDHPHHLVIIGGDLNTELKGNSPFDRLWDDLTTKNRLSYCSHLFTSPGYTYHHVSLGHKKSNDHFIVSQDLLNHNLTSNHRVLEEGSNLSDHLPILMDVTVSIPTNTSKPELTNASASIICL